MKRLLIAILFCLAIPSVLAHPSCSPPAGDWNITNASVLCDNGTSIVISGNITLENATFNLTNGTQINVTSIFVDENSTLLINESAEMNGSVYVNGGNLTVDGGSITKTITSYTTSILRYTNQAAITGDVSVWSSSSGTLLIENTTLFSPPIFAIASGTTTTSIRNATVNATTILFRGDALTVTDSVINATNLSFIRLSTSSVNTEWNVLQNLSIYAGADINFTNATVTATYYNFGAFPGNTTLRGNATFSQAYATSFTASNNLTRVFPLYLVNTSGDPVVGKTVYVLANLSNTTDRAWSGTSDANGYLAPNITVNGTDYNDTFFLYIPGYTGYSTTSSFKLLNDTPLNLTLNTTAPSVTVTATAANIYGGSFHFNASLGNTSVYANYTITNSSGSLWSNNTYSLATLSSDEYNITETFQGIYLPAGTWTINVTTIDQYNNSASNTTTVTSVAAILATLVSSSSQSATIGGAAISFTFNVTTKGAGSVVKSYLNLTNGGLLFDNDYLSLHNDTHNVSVGSDGSYTGAGNVTLPPPTSWPSSITMNLSSEGNIYNDQIALFITPYDGLSAGTYSGSYGFGVFG